MLWKAGNFCGASSMRIYPVLAVRSRVADSKDPSDSTPNLPLSLDLGTISVACFLTPCAMCRQCHLPTDRGPCQRGEWFVMAKDGSGGAHGAMFIGICLPFHVDIAVL